MLDAQFGYVGIYAAGLIANIVMALIAYAWGMSMLKSAVRARNATPMKGTPAPGQPG